MSRIYLDACSIIYLFIGRSWKQAEPILKALEERNVLFDCGRGNALFATELGYLLASALILAAGWDVKYGWKLACAPKTQPK